MIWSLVKITVFILGIAACSMLTIWVIEQDGMLRLEFSNFEITTTTGVAIAAAVLLVPALWLIFFTLGLIRAAFLFATGDLTAVTRHIRKSRERRGLDALADSMVALASGEPRIAAEKISTASLHLDRPELTGLIAAQAEERQGHTENAQKIYRALLSNPSTRFSGLIGILKHRLETGDTKSILELAHKAAGIRPRHAEVQKILQSVQCRTGDWAGARATLRTRFRHNHLSRKEYERGEAVMALAEARILDADGKTQDALTLTTRSLKLQPGLVPAATLGAKLHAGKASRRTAGRILTRAWTLNPHPEIAEAFAGLEPDESCADRFVRFGVLTGKTPNHPETRIVMAELALAKGDHEQAATLLDPLEDSETTARSLILQAAIERARGSPDSVIQTLLGQAVSAPRESQWLCSACHQTATVWDPLCTDCQGFDSLVWQPALSTDAGNALLADMVPRILPYQDAADPDSGTLPLHTEDREEPGNS
ncbi:MAG: heme biosynthesis protein HemY [Rhodobacteraceae bacterium]|nr:heme biosynthesis protein HemY [Paracoccaceae bacterium]